jgi:hypothetical protein
MTKTAAEVMHEAIAAALIDGVAALRTASKGVPNALLRDLNAIHPNTAVADLPAELQASIQASVRAAFVRLQKEGYTVVNPKLAGPARPPRTDGPPRTARTDGPSRAPSGPRERRGPPKPRPGGRPSR